MARGDGRVQKKKGTLGRVSKHEARWLETDAATYEFRK